MIVQCQECRTKFELNDSLLKKEGSKVRCSRCKNTFIVYPPVEDSKEEGQEPLTPDEGFEETVALDSPVSFGEDRMELDEEDLDFEKVFGESPEEAESEEPMERPLPEAALEKGPAEEPEPVSPEEETGTPEETLKTLSAPQKRGGTKLLVSILVVILLVLGALFALRFWAPDLLPDSLSMLKPEKKEPVADTGVRRLSFQAVNGSFLDSQKAGQLFVIRGEVTNHYPTSRSFILVRGSILDDKGQVIKRKEVYAGNIFTEEELKRLPLEEILQAEKNRYGMARKNVNLPPGETISFMIVFANLPENLSEFTVEAVRSSPGA